MIEMDINNFHRFNKSFKKNIFECQPDILLDMIKVMFKENRLKHSISVANVCINLAKKYHIDENKAYLCGLLHDITKSLSRDEHLNYLKYYDKAKLDSPEPILHSYSAVYFIKEKLNYYDSDVLNAIYHHSDGLSNSKLAKILYIADKREPLRNIDDKILDLAYIDLNKAFVLLKEDVKEYLKRNDR